jgi:phosphate starvation-inducible protein PhoH and related proteins
LAEFEETLSFELEDNRLLGLVYGSQDIHLRIIEHKLDVSISERGNAIFISGARDRVASAEKVILHLYDLAKKGFKVTADDVHGALGSLERYEEDYHTPFSGDIEPLQIKTRKKVLKPRTINQQKYIEKILSNELTFGVGPAGTGKTYLAVAIAVSKLLEGEVQRIILSRPAVEAGEKLGFLPGDMREKVDPYLRPIYDALYDFLNPEEVTKKLETGEIEIAPLAFMRGRTLAKSFIIVDEAQNTTSVQMKMLLTRLGQGSRMVVCGDMSQVDLPNGMRSGLVEATQILKGISDVGILEFTSEDVVRHPLVAKIVKAYDKEVQRRKGLNLGSNDCN